MNTNTCTVGSPTHPCGEPAVGSFTTSRGETFHECAEHWPPSMPHPGVAVAVPPYTLHRTASSTIITITATGETIRTASTAPFVLINTGRVVAYAFTTRTRDRWNDTIDGPQGMVIDLR